MLAALAVIARCSSALLCRLQADGVELFVLVADYQTITDRDSPASLPSDVKELIADYLAVGIDPARATIFAHSLIPELNQLMLPFLSLVTLPELLRNPTVKDEAATAGQAALNGLMLTYPVHQAADILFCKATLVPVGIDQLPPRRADPRDRAAIQPPLRTRPPGLSRTAGDARRRPVAAGHRRTQDEQEPTQRDRTRSQRR